MWTVEEALARAEKALPELLQDALGWHSLDVNYEPPHVERLWRPFADDFRLYLHRIHPCDRALYHPHPWPSAIRLVEGEYEMGVGYSDASYTAPGFSPPTAAKLILTKGSMYVMDDRDGWHYVKPLGGPSLSIMITGRPWARWAPKADFTLSSLSADKERALLEDFARYYPAV